jgi:hypothetical protein
MQARAFAGAIGAHHDFARFAGRLRVAADHAKDEILARRSGWTRVALRARRPGEAGGTLRTNRALGALFGRCAVLARGSRRPWLPLRSLGPSRAHGPDRSQCSRVPRWPLRARRADRSGRARRARGSSRAGVAFWSLRACCAHGAGRARRARRAHRPRIALWSLCARIAGRALIPLRPLRSLIALVSFRASGDGKQGHDGERRHRACAHFLLPLSYAVSGGRRRH